jgi:uncharacterized protein
MQNHGKLKSGGFKCTGMSWSAFRPSDDPQRYGYNIPANMYAVGALDRALQLNADVWKSASLSARVTHLAAAIRRGIEQYGIVETEDGAVVYAYEVGFFRPSRSILSDTLWPL